MTLPATSAGDAALAMAELAKGGLSVADSMAAAKGTLQMAAAASMEEADAARLVSTTLNMFKLSGEDATRVADMFANAANKSAAEIGELALGLQMGGSIFAQVGMQVDDATASLALMSNAGIRSSDAGTSLKTMLMRLMAPTDTAAAEMKNLGISVYDAQGKMKPMNDIIAQFSSKLGDGAKQTIAVGGATEKMAKAASGASADVGPLTEKIRQEQVQLGILQNELASTAKKYGASSDQAKKKQLSIDKLNATLAENKGKLSDAGAAIGTYQAAAAGATTATVAMTQEQRNAALETIFGTDAIRAANVVLMGGTAAYGEMKTAVNEAGAAQELAGARTKGLSGALQGLQSVAESLLIEVGERFAPMLEGLARALADLLPLIQSIDPSLLAAAAAFIGVFVAAGPVLAILGGIAAAIAFILSPIGVVILIIALLAAAWASNFGDIQGKTKAVIDFMGKAFTWLGDTVVAVFNAIVIFIQDRLDNIIGLINFFIDRVNDLIGALNNIPGIRLEPIGRLQTMAERGGMFGIMPSGIAEVGGIAGASESTAVNVYVAGSVVTERDIAMTVRDELVRLQGRNRTTGIV
jgi:TP901 family phage tail tape measure protein